VGEILKIEIRGVEKLSFRERQVVVLKEMGHSTESVARQLKISGGTVATLYNRAKTKGYEVVIILEGDPLGLFETVEEEEGDTR
jgi:DNA-directed RNA polymerase specialized sigma24 family protein